MAYMQDIKKTFAIFFLLCITKLYAYDYAWDIEYEIKSESLEYINTTIQNFINEESVLQVYELDWDTYYKMEPEGQKYGIINNYYKLCLAKKNYEPYGNVLQGEIYLSDVKTVVNFYIPYLKDQKKTYFRLVSYCKDIKNIGSLICGTPGKYISFNDVEPTKQEIPIKESFEKNFLSKLALEYEYIKPAEIDMKLSKFLTFFRKRKNFIDD